MGSDNVEGKADASSLMIRPADCVRARPKTGKRNSYYSSKSGPSGENNTEFEKFWVFYPTPDSCWPVLRKVNAR